jgi:hypothetical protein
MLPGSDRSGGEMAGKTDFTEQEWEELRKGATGAGLLVSVSDRSFFDTFKEASSLAKHMAGGRTESSQLVRELAAERGTGFGLSSSPIEIETEALEALRGAIRTLEAKAPDEAEAYRAFVLELVDAVGRAAGGGEQAEAAAVAKIRTALA